MSKHIETILIDDLDGTPAARTTTFALGSDVYSIDLSEEHEAELRQALTPFIRASTRVGRLQTRRRNAKRSNSTERTNADTSRNSEIRVWAARNGQPVAARGRIPSEVVAAFAQAETQRPGEIASDDRTQGAVVNSHSQQDPVERLTGEGGDMGTIQPHGSTGPQNIAPGSDDHDPAPGLRGGWS